MAYWLYCSEYHPVANPAPSTNLQNPDLDPATNLPILQPPALPKPIVLKPEPTTTDPPPPPYSGNDPDVNESRVSATTANAPSGLSPVLALQLDIHMIDNQADDDLIAVSVPLDSDVVTQPSLRTEIFLSTTLSFEEFYSLVCDAMTIPPSRANIGYHFSWEPICTDHHQFYTEDDYQAVSAQMLKKK